MSHHHHKVTSSQGASCRALGRAQPPAPGVGSSSWPRPPAVCRLLVLIAPQKVKLCYPLVTGRRKVQPASRWSCAISSGTGVRRAVLGSTRKPMAAQQGSRPPGIGGLTGAWRGQEGQCPSLGGKLSHRFAFCGERSRHSLISAPRGRELRIQLGWMDLEVGWASKVSGQEGGSFPKSRLSVQHGTG